MKKDSAATHSHKHWHEGIFHKHAHYDGFVSGHHHGVAFRKKPKVIYIGENLEEKLAASIENVLARETHPR